MKLDRALQLKLHAPCAKPLNESFAHVLLAPASGLRVCSDVTRQARMSGTWRQARASQHRQGIASRCRAVLPATTQGTFAGIWHCRRAAEKYSNRAGLGTCRKSWSERLACLCSGNLRGRVATNRTPGEKDRQEPFARVRCKHLKGPRMCCRRTVALRSTGLDVGLPRVWKLLRLSRASAEVLSARPLCSRPSESRKYSEKVKTHSFRLLVCALANRPNP